MAEISDVESSAAFSHVLGACAYSTSLLYMVNVISSSRGIAAPASGSSKIDTPPNDLVERTEPLGGADFFLMIVPLSGSKSNRGESLLTSGSILLTQSQYPISIDL